ncbi:MAG: hypothetical protein U1F87_00225 [Kiritimatiellia bacterium]
MKTIFKLILVMATLMTDELAGTGDALAQEQLPDDQPSKYQLIRYREQHYRSDVNDGYGSSDEEFMKSLNPYRISEGFRDKSLDDIAPRLHGIEKFPFAPPGNTYYTVDLGSFELTIGEHTFSASTGALYWNYACLNVPAQGAESVQITVLNWNACEIGLQTPGTNEISVEWKRIKTTVEGVRMSALVRKSQRDSKEFEWIKGSRPRVARPVPLPENEETAAKRGAVRVGDPMDLATKRLAEVQPGTLAHPPEGSSWSSFWVYGDGLLAIEVDPETKLIRKLAYVLGAAGESPVFLPLNRIHLTDGEMFMPIPPPPSGNTRTPEGKPTVRPPEAAPPAPKP